MPMARRLPGQSLREQWQQLLEDRLIPIVFGPILFWMLLFGIWFGRTNPDHSLRLWLSWAVIVTGVAVIKFLRLIPEGRALIRGERGELLVAEQLEDLRVNGHHCFHDLIRDGFNIDHVVVGPSGVYAIETKYRSGSGMIEFRNGQGMFVGGRAEERDCLKQARGNAKSLRDLIKEHAGFDVVVKSLVVFVGDWKVKNEWQSTDVRVLTSHHISRYFQRQDQPELTRREIELICSHLKRTARAQ